jgi:hypothetical protein
LCNDTDKDVTNKVLSRKVLTKLITSWLSMDSWKRENKLAFDSCNNAATHLFEIYKRGLGLKRRGGVAFTLYEPMSDFPYFNQKTDNPCTGHPLSATYGTVL